MLLSLPGLIILLLLLDRHREDKRAAEASLRRARAALGSGALNSWPCALDLPRKTTLGDMLRQLGKDEGGRSKVTKGKGPQQVLVYYRPVLPDFWTPAPPLPPAPATQESLWSRVKGFLLSLGERREQQRSQQHHQQAQEQHGRVATAKQTVMGTSASVAAHSARNGSRGLGPPMSSLGAIIETLWDVKAQHGGIFKTSVAGLRHRQRVSQLHDGWACELVFNPGRASKPMNLPDADAASLPVRLPFDPSKFNFEKASALDLLFLYEPPAMEGSTQHRALEEAAAGANASHPLACSSRPASSSTAAVLINPYPIGELSGVIAPFVLERRPQDLYGAEEALRLALAFAADASRAAAVAPASSNGSMTGRVPAAAAVASEAGERRSGIRVGYNSIGACASVNAVHFQVFRFDLSPDGLLPLERAPRVLVSPPGLGSDEGEEEAAAGAAAAKDGVELYKIDGGYPLRALMLRAPTLPLLARAASRCVDALVERDCPHSLLMDGQRVFVVPRQKHAKPLPFAVSPGFPEASGLLLVMAEQDFEDEEKLNADLVWKLWSEDMSVGPETFDDLLKACRWDPKK